MINTIFRTQTFNMAAISPKSNLVHNFWLLYNMDQNVFDLSKLIFMIFSYQKMHDK